MVTFHTNHGDIVIKTFDDKAPETVKNFLDYCREGFYNNTIFSSTVFFSYYYILTYIN